MRIVLLFLLVAFISCDKEPISNYTEDVAFESIQGKTCLGDYVNYSLESTRISLPNYRSSDGIYRISIDRLFVLYYNNEYISDYDGIIHFERYNDTLNYAHDIIFQVTHCDSFYFHGILFGKENQ